MVKRARNNSNLESSGGRYEMKVVTLATCCHVQAATRSNSHLVTATPYPAMTLETQFISEDTGLPIELRQKLLNGTGGMTVLPQVAAEAVELANDVNCTISEFSRLVQRDISLTTELLSLANSVMFSGGGQMVTTLGQAAIRLGLRQCRNLIMASSVNSMMKELPIEETWIREVFVQHGLTTANASSAINRKLGLRFQGEEFTAGLVHDLGRSLLAVATGRKFVQADSLEFVEDESMLDSERDILGCDHCEFGAWFAKLNGLPEFMIAAIRWHHQPQLKNPHQALIALTAAGDHIANHLQRFETGEGYQPEENLGIKILADLHGDRIEQEFQDSAKLIVSELVASQESRL